MLYCKVPFWPLAMENIDKKPESKMKRMVIIKMPDWHTLKYILVQR